MSKTSTMSLESVSLVSRFSQMGSDIGEKWRAGKEYYRSKRESIGPLFGYLVIMAIFIVCQTIVMAVISRRMIITSSSFFKELQERNWGELVNKISKTSQQIQPTTIADIPEKELSDLDNQLAQYRKTSDEYKQECNASIKLIEKNLETGDVLYRQILDKSNELKNIRSGIKNLEYKVNIGARNLIDVIGEYLPDIDAMNVLREAFGDLFRGDILFLIPAKRFDWPENNYKKWLNCSSPQDIGYISIGPKKDHGNHFNLSFGIRGNRLSEATQEAVSIDKKEVNITGDIKQQLYNAIKFDEQKFFSKLKLKRLYVKFQAVSFKKIPDP